MPRVRTYYYDPAKLAGETAKSTAWVTGEESTQGGVNGAAGPARGTILGQAREALQNQKPAPATPMQALMEAPPHEEPRVSAIERDVDYGPLTDALSVLDERERWIVEAIFWRRLPLRAVERELSLSKTQVARVRDSALGKLRDVLSSQPELLGALVQ